MINIYEKGPEESKEVNGFIVDGSFTCDTCGEVSDEALYETGKNLLTWKCSNNHVSAANGFGSGG